MLCMAERKEKTRLQMLGEHLRTIREKQEEKQGRRIYQRGIAEWGIGWQEFYRVGGEETRSKWEVSAPMMPIPKLLIPIPFVGNVGANSKVDWLDPVETGESIDVPNEMATPLGPTSVRFACTIVGDSCYDLLWPGDTAVFHVHRTPRIGQIMLFRSFDNHVTVKQIKHDGRQFFLHPLNPAYDDEPAQGQVVGYLVGIVRMMGSKKVTVYDAHGITP